MKDPRNVGKKIHGAARHNFRIVGAARRLIQRGISYPVY